MKVKILGRFWKVRSVSQLGKNEKGEQIRGNIDPPDQTGKALRYLASLQGEELMEVLIHEFTHGADWHKDEDWVHEFGEDLARFLTRMGFRHDP